MSNAIYGSIFILYVMTGVYYMLEISYKNKVKPSTVGELILLIIYLPFTLIIILCWLIIKAYELAVMPIMNSKWWNKKL